MSATAEPKYINSPGSALYDKSRVLFGLNLAAATIAERRRAVLVEGYFDVIMCHQAGVPNVVASSGTAVTDQHLTTLRALAPTLLLCLDTDDAGLRGTERAMLTAQGIGLEVLVLDIPGYKDPAEALLANPHSWPALEAAAVDGWAWWLQRVLDGFDMGGADGRAAAARAAVSMLAQVSDRAALGALVADAARQLRVSASYLAADLRGAGGPLVEARDGMSHLTQADSSAFREGSDLALVEQRLQAQDSGDGAGRDELLAEYRAASRRRVARQLDALREGRGKGSGSIQQTKSAPE